MKWIDLQIGQLCLPTELRDPQTVPDAPFKYIDISSVDKDHKAIISVQELFGRDAPSRARKVVRTGDILVSTVRPNLNAVAIVPGDLDDQIASTGFCVLRPNTQIVENRYLFYRTQTPEFVSFLISRMRGASYPAVTDGVVRAAGIPLLPPSEQRRIVEILDQADTLRKKRAEAEAKAERILPALFYKMFGDPVTNPKRWAIATLQDVTKIIYRYPTFYGQGYVEFGVPVVRISDILPNHVLIRNVDQYAKVPKEFSDEFPLTLLEPKDIVMAVRGDTTGKIGLVPNELAGANISPNLIRISPDTAKVKPYYLFTYMLLAGHNFSSFITNTAKKSITARNLKSTLVLVPPIGVQECFELGVSNILKIDESRLISSDQIEKLFLTLLYRAFSGNLTAKWREAHMKELLAEMEEQAKYFTTSNTNDHRETADLQESLF